VTQPPGKRQRTSQVDKAELRNNDTDSFAEILRQTPRGCHSLIVFISRCSGQGASSCLIAVNGNQAGKGSATVILG